MCCEHLACASCAQPVSDARCPVCRAARARLHRQPATLPATAVVLLAALLLALAVLVQGALTH